MSGCEKKVSIVIPSNRKRVQTLDSVKKIEDFVCDINIIQGGSVGSAMSYGAERASSKILLFLDDDMQFTREFFLNAMKQLEAHPKCLVGLKTSDGMSCMFMLIRKQHFFEVGAIKLPNYYLDTEFGFRAEKHGVKRFLHPVSSVTHLSPTPSGFFSRRQRLLSFYSCYVILHHQDLYTENFGKWRNIRLRDFIFRGLDNPLKTVYMDTLLFIGVVYFGCVHNFLSKLRRLVHHINYKLHAIFTFQLHLRSMNFPLFNYLRFRKLKKMLKSGEYEPEVTKFIKTLNGDLFVDIGANIGYFSILASKTFKRVYAFEPFPKTFKLLEKCLSKLDVLNVIPVKMAVMDTESTAVFGLFNYSIPKFDATTHMQLGLPEETHVPLKTLRISTTTLAAFFKDQPIDLVKVDVEGNEWAVIKGAEPIMPQIASWIVEIHYANRKKELERDFINYGYFTKWLDDSHIFASKKQVL